MSINSTSNLAVARRLDFEPAGTTPKDLKGIVKAAGATPPPVGGAPGAGPAGNNPQTALQTLTAYIPTEILTLYVSAIAALGSAAPLDELRRWLPFVSFLVITPLAVWAAFATKISNAGRRIPFAFSEWPLWEMSAATIAYVAWAFALPNTPFAAFKDWYSPGLAGFLILVISWGLGVVAPLAQRPLVPAPPSERVAPS